MSHLELIFFQNLFFGSHSDGQRPDHFIQRGHFGALLATPCLHPKQNLSIQPADGAGNVVPMQMAGRGGSKQSMLMERANTHQMDWFKGNLQHQFTILHFFPYTKSGKNML